MSDFSTDREVYGSNVLTGLMIAGAIFLGLAFLSGLSPQMGQKAVDAQSAHQIAVSATTSQQS